MWAWISLVRCIHWQLTSSQVAELAQKGVITSKTEASAETVPDFQLEWGCVRWRESRRRLTRHRACLSGIGAICPLQRSGWLCKTSVGITACHAKMQSCWWAAALKLLILCAMCRFWQKNTFASRSSLWFFGGGGFFLAERCRVVCVI